MDYPKSVANVGLVDGKFIDENTATGAVGSLIPSVWGNAVTDEILNALIAGDQVPDEAKHDQLAKAIAQIARYKGRILSLSADTVLTSAEMELLLLDATAANRTFTLPVSNAALGVRDVIVRRVDNGGNRLVVKAAGADKIKFHTHLSPAGYPFLVLMGAGDWWHLRSDGAGSWWPIARYDSTPLGRPVFETTTAFSPGGWVAHNGFLYSRAEWPWVWDHAQASGMLTTEALRSGKEGCWTSGDGATTFRSPEARGEFVRVLDESRGVDASRVAGSYQKGSLLYGNDDNGAEVHGLNSISTQRAGLGWDLPVIAEYTGISTYTNASVNVPGGTLFAVTHYGVARPRNIAYPGRIKLI